MTTTSCDKYGIVYSLSGASLEQVHVFALAHILRRPIIIYGVKVVKSFRGESIDFARFEGKWAGLCKKISYHILLRVKNTVPRVINSPNLTDEDPCFKKAVHMLL